MSDTRTLSGVLRADQRRAAVVLVVLGVLALASVSVPWQVFGPREDRLDDALVELSAADAVMRERQLAVRTSVITGTDDLLLIERALRDDHERHLRAAEDLLRQAGVSEAVTPVRDTAGRWTTDVVERLAAGDDFVLDLADERFADYREAHVAAVDAAGSRRDDVRRTELVVVLGLAALTVVVLVVAGVDFARRRRRLEREVVVPLESLVRAAGDVGAGAVDADARPATFSLEDLRVLAAVLADLDAAIRERDELVERSRRRDERLRLAHDLSGSGFVVVDGDGRLVEVNDAFARLVGRDPTELLGTSVTTLVDPDDLEPLVEAGRSVTDGNAPAAEVEVRLLAADTRTRWARVTVSCSRDPAGHVVNLMAQVSDVTDRRAAEEDQERYRRELERSNSELEQFAYVASHDLSEPLRVMSGFAELLQYDLGDDLDEDTDRHLDFILAAAGRMQRLIEDLLAYSRVGRVDAPAAAVDLDEVARDVVALVRDELADVPVTFEVEPLPVVVTAPTHARHLLLNLVSNAVKFRSTEQPPVVRVSAGPTEHGLVTVYVDDNGIGIEEKFRERIFRMFQRLHGRDEYPGTGMGLAICRKIADLYGGSLHVEGSPLGGSRFVLRLPLAPLTEPPTGAE